MRCPSCSADVADGQKLCGSCGKSLLAERRQVTVAFCDLVGSTALSRTLDPEDLREVIHGFHELCRRAVTRLDGHVAQFLGDGVLVYFGYPKANEDASERAVQAALDIIQHARATRLPTGSHLQVRIGIATGLVVVGGQSASEGGAYGETPNLAARLQALAEPDTVVIAESTHRLLGNRYELADLGEHELKGIAEPVRAWRVVAAIAAETRWSATHAGTGSTPIIGRQHEAEVIAQSWDRACRGEPQSVQLIGEPGIGKSRLAQLALDIAREGPQAQTVVLQCSPLQTQSALAPVVAWLRRAVLGAETVAMSEAIASGRLREFLRAELPGNPLAEPLIAPLVGLPAALPAELAADTPDARRLKTLQCIASLIGGAARPRLVVVEDLHWADPSTLELIELLAAGLSARPVMLLGTARPEWSPVDWAPTICQRLAIQRLSHEDAVNLALHVVRNLSVESSIVQTIAQRTDGVPLFLEEMAKSIAETWLSHARTPEAAGGNKLQLSIPGSLTDSLMARLDRMDQGKSVAQAAATLGREFEHALLEAVWQGSPEVLQSGLAQLLASEMLFSHDEGAGVEYRFKHALIRDAAYESMLKSTRAEQHRSVARVIEARFPALAERRPELVAQHYTAGRDPEKAVGYWLAASVRTLQQNACVETLSHIRSGLEVCADLAEGLERDKWEMQLQTGAVSALLAVQGYGDPQVQVSCERVLALCEKFPGAPQQIIATVALFSYNVVRANHALALGMAQRFMAVARASANEDLLLEALLDCGCARLFQGDLAAARTDLEACIELYSFERHGTHCHQFGQDPKSTAHVFLSWVEWIAGDPVRARAHSEEARKICRALRHPNTTAFWLSLCAFHALFAGDLDTAGPMAEEELMHCKEHQLRNFHAHADVLVAWVRHERGDPGKLAAFTAGIERFLGTGARVFLTHWQAYLAAMQAEAGQAELANRTLAEALDRVARNGEHWGEPEALRLRGDVLRHLGEPASAVQAAYREALAVAQARGFRGWGVRAAVSLARSLAAEQRGDEALGILREALAGFPAECPGENNVAEARRLITELG